MKSRHRSSMTDSLPYLCSSKHFELFYPSSKHLPLNSVLEFLSKKKGINRILAKRFISNNNNHVHKDIIRAFISFHTRKFISKKEYFNIGENICVFSTLLRPKIIFEKFGRMAGISELIIDKPIGKQPKCISASPSPHPPYEKYTKCSLPITHIIFAPGPSQKILSSNVFEEISGNRNREEKLIELESTISDISEPEDISIKEISNRKFEANAGTEGLDATVNASISQWLVGNSSKEDNIKICKEETGVTGEEIIGNKRRVTVLAGEIGFQ